MKKIKLLVKEAKYQEVGIGSYVELLDDYVLIRAGSVGKIVGFTKEGRIKVEFPIAFVCFIPPNTKPRRRDRFIEADESSLKAISSPTPPLKEKGKR